MSVYKHPTQAGHMIIKIFHGRKGKPDYINFPGDRDAALAFERDLRGKADLSDPAFGDYLPEFRVAYKNRSAKTSLESLLISFDHLQPFLARFGCGTSSPPWSSSIRRRDWMTG